MARPLILEWNKYGDEARQQTAVEQAQRVGGSWAQQLAVEQAQRVGDLARQLGVVE